jgi:hypothetical protein
MTSLKCSLGRFECLGPNRKILSNPSSTHQRWEAGDQSSGIADSQNEKSRKVVYCLILSTIQPFVESANRCTGSSCGNCNSDEINLGLLRIKRRHDKRLQLHLADLNPHRENRPYELCVLTFQTSRERIISASKIARLFHWMDDNP